MDVRLPCPRHRWHDVDAVDAARVVATLTAALLDEQMDPTEADDAELWCPADALALSGDVEGYLEYTRSALIEAEITPAEGGGQS